MKYLLLAFGLTFLTGCFPMHYPPETTISDRKCSLKYGWKTTIAQRRQGGYCPSSWNGFREVWSVKESQTKTNL